MKTLRLAGDGLVLAADVFGPAQASPVLFFHGGGQSRRSWRGAARKVAAAGYRALTFDLRGHGDSDWASDGDYLLDAYARDVERLLESFDHPVTLVGASRGGQSALVGGSRHPQRVNLVVLADVAPRIQDGGVGRIREFLQTSLQGFNSVDEAAQALATQLGQLRAGDPANLLKAMRRGESGRLFWHWDPKTVSLEFLNPPSEGAAVEAAAARIRSPVVLIRAEYSDVVNDESVTVFRELTPQLIVQEAKGVGHMFTGDRNDAFAATLLEHLARFAPLREAARHADRELSR